MFRRREDRKLEGPGGPAPLKETKTAGIIAAGDGSRFKKSGVFMHKPLIPVAGLPLIGHALKNMESLGVQKVVIIFNESETDCVRWVEQNFPRLEFQFIVKSTRSSYESFCLVGEKLGPGRHLISTVDAFCLVKDLKKMWMDIDPESVILGVTSFVDDEKPLWVQIEKKTGRIRDLGGPSGQYATAGLYYVPDGIFKKHPDAPMASLRWYLKWLLEEGIPFYGARLTKVVDVDMPKDVKEAEKLYQRAQNR